MKKILSAIIICAMLLTLSACSPGKAEVQEILLSVLNNEKTFITESEDAVFLEDYQFNATKGTNSEYEYLSAVPSEYAFVDFNRDEIQELVVNVYDSTAKYGAILVFYFNGNDVLCFEFKQQDMLLLKADGSFMMNAGTGGTYYCGLAFGDTLYSLVYNAISDVSSNTFEIDGKPCTSAELTEYIAEWNLKDSVTWHTYNGSSNTIMNFEGTNSFSAENSAVIDLNNYVSVTFEGQNSIGYATVTFDKEQFLLDNYNKIAFNEENIEIYKELYGYVDESAANAFLNFISVKLDVVDNLSNGDNVYLLWNIDDHKISSYFIANYIYPSKSFTVSGLAKGNTFNPFDGFDIQFSGVSPYGTASYPTYHSYYGGTYKLSQSTNLKNGSKVKVTYTCEDEATMMRLYGAYPSVFEKTYKVSGLSSYVQSTDEISDSQYNQIVAEAASHIWVQGYGHYPDATYCGNYFFTAKGDPSDNYSPDAEPTGNMILLVFSHPENWNETESPTVYSVIKLYNILIDDNGYISYDLDGFYSENSYYSNESDLKALANQFKYYMKCTDNLLIN